MGPLLILILLFVVMYAAMIRPQQRRAREHQSLIAAVQVGDEVMTTAGIFGTVTAVEGDVITVEISPGVVMRVARAAIGRRLSQELEAGETLDDGDDDFGESAADQMAPDPPATPTPEPSPPPSSEAPPAAPPTAQTPPPGTGPATPGPGPGSAEPG
jgi:preprotein translocase subunit YajC